MDFDGRTYRLLNCSYCRCAICQTWIEKAGQRATRDELPMAPEVVGFVYGDESSLQGWTGPIILHRNRLQSSISTVGDPIKVLPVEDVRWSFGKQLLEAFAFHYDCYVLLRKALRLETPAEVASIIWLLAHSSQPTIPVWPVEHAARSRLWVKQIFQDRCSLRSQLALTEKNDSEAAELLEHLLELPEEILEEISIHIPFCGWTRLAAVLYVSSFSDSLRSNALYDCHIDLDADLFVLHLPLFGRRYIARIQNYPFYGSETLGCTSSNNQVIVFSDEIGILDISSSSAINAINIHHDGIPKRCEVAFSVEPDMNLNVRLKKKGGIFLGLESACDKPPPFSVYLEGPRIALEVPDRVWLHPWRVSSSNDLNDRIEPPIVNFVGLGHANTGMSVTLSVVHELGFYISLYIHSGDERIGWNKHNLEKSKYSQSLGLKHEYFPLAEGEFITQIWARRHVVIGQTPWQHLAFAVQTNRNRLRTFGPWIEEHQREDFVYVPLRKRGEGRIIGLFYGIWWISREIRWPWSRVVTDFSVGCNEGPEESEVPLVYPWPESPLRSPINEFDQEDFYGFPSQDWHFSEAPLEGVVSIERCLHPKRDDDATAGLMLHYRDRREVIGQWNFNWQIISHDAAFTHLALRRYTYSNLRLPSIQIVPRDHSARQDSDGIPTVSKWWLEDDVIVFPMRGRLIWFYSIHGDAAAAIRQDGSPLTSSFMGYPTEQFGRM